MTRKILLICLSLLSLRVAAVEMVDTLFTFENVAAYYPIVKKKIKTSDTPVAVNMTGVKTTTLSLNGTWHFSPAVEEGFEKQALKRKQWHEIYVPSEWYMQSFKVEKNKWGGYRREFVVPSDWKTHRVKIRFGAVQSECRVYVNGSFVGEHQGAMTQFEMELTPYLRPGKNEIALYVRSESFADEASKISHYAKHQVGGILRGVELFVVPQTYINELHADALLNETLDCGTLQLTVCLNDSLASRQLGIVLKERGIEGGIRSCREIYRKDLTINRLLQTDIKLNTPNLWHAEHPYLYTLEISLFGTNGVEQVITKDVGFRKIEIRGNSLYVNGKQVKLHGVARHDIWPYSGRAIADTALLRKDVELLRNANCNYIRTSHYPPDAFMLDLCDRYGIFVEDEAPVCWGGWQKQEAKRADQLFYCFKAMLYRDRSHPCILLWSIANESRWQPCFYPCLQLAREITPHIPVKFSHTEYQGIKKGPDIGAKHYPGWQGLMSYDNYFRPMLFGEALHLNAYNTSENITDPGLRDVWGDFAKFFVDNMQESPAIAGLGIWGCFDEMFYPKGQAPCGYGPWGVLDGFRREKPEFWHMKMAYSPIVIVSRHFQCAKEETFVMFENRYNVLHADAVDILWRDGEHSGVVRADAAPGAQGVIRIPHVMQGDTLQLVVRDRRGFDISEWRLPRHYQPHYSQPALAVEGKVQLVEFDTAYRIQTGNLEYLFSRKSGELVSVKKAGKLLFTGGVKLYLIPSLTENEVIDFIPQDNPNLKARFASDACRKWTLKSMKWEQKAGIITITTQGLCDSLPVEWEYRMDGEGRLRIDYLVNLKKMKDNFRQIGIGFDLPADYTTLTWKRKALWSYYPKDHIGRPEGVAEALYPETLHNYYARQEIPQHAYARDGNRYGSNDFRSTKHNLITASLTTKQGAQILLESNGRQHLRTWLSSEGVSFLLANHSNGGGEHYLRYDADRTKYSVMANNNDFTGWMQVKF